MCELENDGGSIVSEADPGSGEGSIALERNRMYMVLRGDVFIKKDEGISGAMDRASLGLATGRYGGSPRGSVLADSPLGRGMSPSRLGGSPQLSREGSPGLRGSRHSTPRKSSEALPPTESPKVPQAAQRKVSLVLK